MPPKNTQPQAPADEDYAPEERAAAEERAELDAEEDRRITNEREGVADYSTPEPGPSVIDGPLGTTVDSTDQRLGTLRVEIRSNVTLGNELYRVGQKVRVVDDGETRGALHVGHVRLLNDGEALDSE